MKIDRNTIFFKTDTELYDKERDGHKPYTIRILSFDEARRVLEWFKYTNDLYICITKPIKGVFDATQSFNRILTDVSVVSKDILGHMIVGFAWSNEHDVIGCITYEEWMNG